MLFFMYKTFFQTRIGKRDVSPLSEKELTQEKSPSSHLASEEVQDATHGAKTQLDLGCKPSLEIGYKPSLVPFCTLEVGAKP